ncbi:manganese efflux pump [Clostridium sp. DMHC 10]|uniref:manganese efflux pump n=1 Tax=Clostridium sp. DMHC 10 TaxID=747377 RepID=UPI00069D2ED4|nr:manganese efflux pump [Clostridium sp. DMHC 10]
MDEEKVLFLGIVQFLITFFAILGLALTLSADDFSVGVAYGLFKTRLPFKSLMIMVLGSATSTYGIMLIGKFIFTSMPDYVTDWLSAIILGAVGCKMIYDGWKERSTPAELIKTEHIYSSNLKTANFLEAYLVGVGLGVDDFAQALGLAVAGFPIILTVCLLEVAEVVALLSGNFLALKGFSKKINGKISIIPGVVLLLVALYQVLF